MSYVRQRIRDFSDLALKQVNDNFQYIWLKLSGNIDTMDFRDKAVTGKKVADDTIEGTHIKYDSIGTSHLQADSVDAHHVKAEALTAYHINTSTLVVGENIAMSPSAVISWGQINGAPNLADSNYFTQIGQNYVFTGYVVADNIMGNMIAGKTLRTIPSGVLNTSYVNIGQDTISFLSGASEFAELSLRAIKTGQSRESLIRLGHSSIGNGSTFQIRYLDGYTQIHFNTGAPHYKTHYINCVHPGVRDYMPDGGFEFLGAVNFTLAKVNGLGTAENGYATEKWVRDNFVMK